MPYGDPILSPMNAQTLDCMEGKHGKLQVRELPDTDTFGLFYAPDNVDRWTMLACHPNGHSCKELGKRILAAWEGTGDGTRAVEQFDFILRCGGLGRTLETVLAVIRGQY